MLSSESCILRRSDLRRSPENIILKTSNIFLTTETPHTRWLKRWLFHVVILVLRMPCKGSVSGRKNMYLLCSSPNTSCGSNQSDRKNSGLYLLSHMSNHLDLDISYFLVLWQHVRVFVGTTTPKFLQISCSSNQKPKCQGLLCNSCRCHWAYTMMTSVLGLGKGAPTRGCHTRIG